MADNEFVQAFDQAWAPFREAVAAQTDPDRRVAEDGWTVKELLSHVAFWDETVGPVLHMILRGQPGMPADWPGFASGYQAPDDGTWPHFDVHNAREAEWARSQTAETVIDRLDTAYAQARAYLAACTPEEVQDERFREYVLDEKAPHYEQHRRDLAET